MYVDTEPQTYPCLLLLPSGSGLGTKEGRATSALQERLTFSPGQLGAWSFSTQSLVSHPKVINKVLFYPNIGKVRIFTFSS